MNKPIRWAVRVTVWLGALGWWILPTLDYAIDGDSQTSAWRYLKGILYENLWRTWNPPDYWDGSPPTGIKWDTTFYSLFFYVLLIGAVLLLVETLWRNGSGSGESKMLSPSASNLLLGRAVVWASTAFYWVWGVTGGYFALKDQFVGPYQKRDFTETVKYLAYKNWDLGYLSYLSELRRVASVSMFIVVWSLLILSVLLCIRPVYGQKSPNNVQTISLDGGGPPLAPPGILGEDAMRPPGVDDTPLNVPPGILD